MITGSVYERSAACSACAWSWATKIASIDTRICIHLRQEHRAPAAGLIEGHGEQYWPQPGRIFAAARSHTFKQLADATDDAFARRDDDDGESPPPRNPGLADLPPLRPHWGPGSRRPRRRFTAP
jgi:hypothetical protein